jgi:two-component system chemotaxis response regulator CheB
LFSALNAGIVPEIKESAPMDAKIKQVLLVDDDPGLLFALSKDLSSDQDAYRLILAQNGRAAMEILARETISLVVSDVNMPEINGFELLAAIREKYPQIGVILMTAYGTDKMRQIVKDCGCLHFLEKPFRFDMLKEMIQGQLGNKAVGFNGTLKNILLTDLIQICCIAGADMAIKVTNGQSEGVFYIESGQLIHAQCGEERGETALFKIIGWENGSFESFSVKQFPEQTIFKPYMYFLMEGARRSDEENEEFSPEESDEDNENQNKQWGWDEEDESLNILENNSVSSAEVIPAAKPTPALRVMIVDDSSVMCRILSDTLTENDGIEIAGTAKNGQDALKQIEEQKPGLVTLDVNMPVMGGGTALKHIMIKNRCPVVIISSLNSGSYQNILDFLLLGAVDFIGKPVRNQDEELQKHRMVEKIINAGKARIARFIRYKPPVMVNPEQKQVSAGPAERIVLVHAGPGGYAELVRLISRIPAGRGISLVVMHDMAPEFTQPFSRYLDQRSHLHVSALSADQPLLQEHCYINVPASGFRLEKRDSAYVLETAGPMEEMQCCLQVGGTISAGAQVMNVLLSGASLTQLHELKRFKELDGRIIVKTPGTCMVPDSPEAAIRSGLATDEAHLDKIAEMIAEFGGWATEF